MQISKLINSCLRLLPSERPTAKETISFANSVMKKNGNILRHNIPSNGTLKQSKAFHNTYCTSILEAMRKYRIAQSADNLLYGIIDDKGNVIVDFLYDKIHKLGEFCWPGPLSPQKSSLLEHSLDREKMQDTYSYKKMVVWWNIRDAHIMNLFIAVD